MYNASSVNNDTVLMSE